MGDGEKTCPDTNERGTSASHAPMTRVCNQKTRVTKSASPRTTREQASAGRSLGQANSGKHPLQIRTFAAKE